MKKIIFSAAAFAVVAVSTAVVAPTTSEAVPAFARQTGAACASCHFQAFPTLTSFGAAFKHGAFTDVGEQALTEDDGLSITSVLNMSINSRIRFIKEQTTTVTGGVNASATLNMLQMPDETPVFIGGRIGTNTGAFFEYTGGVAGGWQLFNSFDAGDYKVGLNMFNGGFGWTWGLETSNVYSQHGGMHQGKNIAAEEQVMAAANGNQGVTAYIANDLIAASVVLTTDGGNGLNGANALTTLIPGLRVWFTPEVAGWNLGMGVGVIKGSKAVAATGTGAATTTVQANNTFVDFQAMGEVGDMSVGIFADYATAKATAAVGLISLNSLTAGQKYDGYSVRTSIEPVHGVIMSLGYGSQTIAVAASPDQNTTWVTTGISYSIYQNFEVALTHQIQSINNNGNVAGDTSKVKTTMLQVEAVM